MKFIPILFNTLMVQAILDKRKNQTRRTKGLEKFNISPDLFKCRNNRIETCRLWDSTKEENPNPIKTEYVLQSSDGHENRVQCPYGQPGDILWVRESFRLTQPFDPETYYFGYKDGFHSDNAASYKYDFSEPDVWNPSIYMPKEACRIFLKVKQVRVERLNDITHYDSVAEGIEELDPKSYDFNTIGWRFKDYKGKSLCKPIASFKTLWESINGYRSWNLNPWVWVVEFERVNLKLSEKQFFFK